VHVAHTFLTCRLPSVFVSSAIFLPTAGTPSPYQLVVSDIIKVVFEDGAEMVSWPARFLNF